MYLEKHISYFLIAVKLHFKGKREVKNTVNTIVETLKSRFLNIAFGVTIAVAAATSTSLAFGVGTGLTAALVSSGLESFVSRINSAKIGQANKG